MSTKPTQAAAACTCHLALRVNEVLTLIFSFNDKNTNALCARVCRAWSESALNELWRGLGLQNEGCFHNLLEVLCPLSTVSAQNGTSRKKKVFSEELRPRNWLRFEHYANRVKRLKTLHLQTFDNIDKSVFIELGLFRPMHKLLPNLIHFDLDLFECNAQSADEDVGLHLPRYAMILLHEGVTNVDLCLPEADTTESLHSRAQEIMISLPRLFEEVAARAQHITSVTLDFNHRISSIEADLIEFLRGLKDLKQITLPRCTVTPALLTFLASRSKIRSITLKDFWCVEGSIDDIDKTFTLPHDVSYSPLERLHMHGAVQRIRPLFDRSITGVFSDLVELRIGMVKPVLPAKLKDLLHSFPKSCPSLESLALVRDADYGIAWLKTEEKQPITASTLAPLAESLR